MKKHYYNAGSLERALHSFEEEYGLSSAAFYKAHTVGRAPARVTAFDRVVWADMYREVCRAQEQDPEPKRKGRAKKRRAALQPAG